MRSGTWRFLSTAPNSACAKALVGSLIADGVTAMVITDSPILGEGQPCSVFVDAAQLHRARWLLTQGKFTDAELAFMATGSWEPDGPMK